MSGNNQDYDNQNDDSQNYDDDNQDQDQEYDSQDDNSQNNADNDEDDDDQQNDNDNANDNDNDDEGDGDEDDDDGNNSGGPKYIRLRGLPWSATHKEILDFLKNVNVIGGAKGIHLITSRWDGKNTGEAYVEVKGQQDVIAAMKLDDATMGHRYIEVFNAAPREAREAMRKTSIHGNSYVVKLRGLPYSVTEQQVEEFFNGLEIKPDREGIIFVMDRKGRATGEAFVQFESQEDTEQALGRNREKIGHRYIEIFRSSLAELRRSTNGNGRMVPYDLKDRGSNRGGSGSDFGGSNRSNRWGYNGNGGGVGANNTLGFGNIPNFGNNGNFGNNNGGGNFGNFGNNGGGGGRGGNFGNFGNNGGGNFGNFGNNGGGGGGGNFGNNSGGGGGSNNGGAFNRFSGNSGNFGNDFGDFGNFGNNRGNGNAGGSNNGGGGGGGGGTGGFNSFGNFGNNFGGNNLSGGFGGNMSNMGGGGGGNNGGGGNFGPIGGGRNDDYYVVHMLGLPFSSFENDVFKFFEPLRPANVRIHYNNENRHNGTAEAMFETHEKALLAMRRHRCKMGQRYIELFFYGKSSNKGGNNNFSPRNKSFQSISFNKKPIF